MTYTFLRYLTKNPTLKTQDLEILEQKAVDAAMNLNWKDAVKTNKEILKADKKNIQALLRLGFAQIQLHRLSDAKTIYRKVLKIQPANQLAQENIERIKILESRGGKKLVRKDISLDPSLFLELPGKTKSVHLVKLGQKNILAQLSIGQQVILKPKRRRLEVRTSSNEYIGSLPDDLSRTLILFVKAGGEYTANIKEISLHRVVVFIKELKKAKKYAKFHSFPKTAQAEISRIPTEEDVAEEEEEAVENELENLAESLHEEKEVLPYQEEEDEENLEE